MAHEIPIAALARARSEFQRVLEAAVPAYELGQLGLFNDDTEGYIRKEVDRKLYEPKLPNAGDRERKWVERLEKLAALREWSGSKRAFFAAQRVKELLPKEPWNPGKYYERQPLTIRNGKQEFEWLRDLRDLAESEKHWERKWFADLLLGGLPEEVSNFRIECLYLLKMPDGEIQRRVRLVNILGEMSGEINLDSKAFASPEKFRDWCLSKGNFAWSGNQTALQSLHADICAEAAWKVINLVVTMGWYPLETSAKAAGKTTLLEGVWFMGDCGFRDGKRLAVNESCYWLAHKDDFGNDLPAEGYQVADEGRENPFFHKKPLLKPDQRITSAKLKFSEKHNPVNGAGEPVGLPASPSEDMLMARFFRELCCRLKAVCGESANLIVGSTLAYAAAPEIFNKHSLFPGLFVHGTANSGKSTILEWMMECWGMSLHNGIILRGNNSTPTGLLQVVDQYSNLPVWLDEFRMAEVGDDKKAVIHNFYNRGGQAKFSLSKLQRSIRTNALISGESTSSDGALRSRFPHVQVAKSMRTGTPEEQVENYKWFQEHRQHFRLFGLWLLEHRELFVKRVLFELDQWDRQDIDQRLKIVHGVGYASWWAMASLMEEQYPTFTADEATSFRQFVLDHSMRASVDVVSETNTNIFWTDLLAAVRSGAIPAECFKVKWDLMEGPPGAMAAEDGTYAQGPWKSYRLYIEPYLTLASLQKELVKQRGNVTLKVKDYRDQLGKEAYWLGGQLRNRFNHRGTAGGVPCWGIAVDLHPLGYIQVSDEAYEHYRRHKGEGDPRKGPLFELVEWLESKEEDDEGE